eukprot:COSAG01_NODE_706_length_14134_cov_6.562309_1_plen_39_part_00
MPARGQALADPAAAGSRGVGHSKQHRPPAGAGRRLLLL